MREERRWFVGIDWASQEHVVSLCDSQGKKIGERKFADGGTGLVTRIGQPTSSRLTFRVTLTEEIRGQGDPYFRPSGHP